jgi:anti-sigma factor (TIGR02949 family)
MSAAAPAAGSAPGADESDSHAYPGSRGEPCGCDEAIGRLFEYLDAEMPEPDCVRVAAHLAVCASCHDAASAERHVRELLRRSCQQTAPEALRVRVVAEMIVRRVRGAVGAD